MVEFIDSVDNNNQEPEDSPASKSTEKREDKSTLSDTHNRPPSLKLQATITIPGYTILSKIGERTTSTVWKAKQESLNRMVAIRILKPQYTSNQKNIDDFINEAKIVAKLKNANIIQIYDFGNQDGIFYIVMEYVEGQTLSELLDTSKSIPQEQALTIAAAIADALDEAWSKGKISHRDINPENIMLENDGSIKVSNLGLAAIIQSHDDTTANNEDIVRDPCYASPELLSRGESVDYRTDMYSLGAVLYHMLTGKKPFADKKPDEISSAHKFEQIPFPRDIKPTISTGCAQMIMRLMMKEPRHRFDEWAMIHNDLLKLAEGKIVVTKIPPSSVSTIAAPSKITPTYRGAAKRKPALAVARPAQEKQQRLKELKSKYSKKKAPAWLKLPLEALMLSWFCWLGYQLLWLPVSSDGKHASTEVAPPSPTANVVSDSSSPAIPAPEPKHETARHAAPKPSHTPRRPRPNKSPTVTPQKNRVDSQDAKISEQQTPPENDYIPPPLNEVKKEILKILMKRDSKAALHHLNQAYPDSNSADVKALRDFLAGSFLKEKAVLAALGRSIGIKMPLVIKNRRRTISVSNVKDNLVSADLYVSTGSSQVIRPVKFKIADIAPLDQIKLLGNDSRPNVALTKFIIYMTACDYMKALSVSDQCGPLAKTCKAEAEAKIKMLMGE